MIPPVVSVWPGTWPVKAIWSAHPFWFGTPGPVKGQGFALLGVSHIDQL